MSVLGSKLGKESASQIRPEPTPEFRQLTPASHQSAHTFGPKTGEKSCEFDTTVENQHRQERLIASTRSCGDRNHETIPQTSPGHAGILPQWNVRFRQE
jgi:hypothetical protein